MAKYTTDDYLALDIRWLAREGFICEYQKSDITTWSRYIGSRSEKNKANLGYGIISSVITVLQGGLPVALLWIAKLIVDSVVNAIKLQTPLDDFNKVTFFLGACQ